MAYTVEQLETKAALIEKESPNSVLLLIAYVLIEILREAQAA